VETLFPFGFPAPTARYLALYVVTLAVHVIFMNYVLAGTAYVLVQTLRRTGTQSVIAATLRDWMPFALSGAITAGVAPLLFVQVLYPVPFYTANLLLAPGWMLILPALVTAFYLAYLIKSRMGASRPRLTVAATLVSTLAYLFVAFSWTENHLLSLSREAWPDVYIRGPMFVSSPGLAARLGIWSFGSVTTMAVLVAWQCLRHPDASRDEVRGLARTALVFGIAAVASALVYLRTLDPAAREALRSPMAMPYAVVAALGHATQLAAWASIARVGRFRARELRLATLGVVATILGVSVSREAVRLSAIDVSALYAGHARAAAEQGLTLFVLFLVANSAIIVACVRLVFPLHRRSGGRKDMTESR
jgi:hypothetical protein